MATSTKPTSTQLDVLRHLKAEPTRRLRRLQGGFWTTPSTPLSGRTELVPSSCERYDVPSWFDTVHTIRAMEKRGWLCRAGVHSEDWRDERELTAEGLAVAG